MLWVYSEFSIKRFFFIIIFVCRTNLSSDMMFSDMKFMTSIAILVFSNYLQNFQIRENFVLITIKLHYLTH
jgi:hypothetical protein